MGLGHVYYMYTSELHHIFDQQQGTLSHCACVVYWGQSPSNSLCDAGRTLLTQTWSNTETFMVNQVRIRITD